MNNFFSELQAISNEFKKYESWANKKPWIKRLSNRYKGVYLSEYITNTKLLSAALYFVKHEILSRTSIIADSEKSLRRLKDVKVLWTMLLSMSPHSVPYSASTVVVLKVKIFVPSLEQNGF